MDEERFLRNSISQLRVLLQGLEVRLSVVENDRQRAEEMQTSYEEVARRALEEERRAA